MIQGRIIGVHALHYLNRVLREYVRLRSHKDQAEILQQKGIDLLIQLYRGYRARRWRGGKRIGWRELKARSKKGKGVKVRSRVLEAHYASRAPKRTRRGHPLTFWQKLVYQEISKRQEGIGVLAVGFLPRRWRWRVQQNGEKARVLMNNRSRKLGTLVQVSWGPGFFRVVGSAPGSRQVSFRYGIEEQAMDRVARDMNFYIARKTKAGLEKHLRHAGF